ncbi:DEAD/DEAH box helicase [Castellaniella caeni]|uniref:DEAD/DEAH box helicase n=1 Tax=Castellaniella caeni TaxID=266123 RepID=UPI000C9F0B78|nr:DEAD/DEAH box helicase [Castellaniella caeni]
MTRLVFTPRAYQGSIIEHLLDTPRCAAWAGMGLGKTVSTLTALDALEFVDPGPALVLAPKRVAGSTWPDEAAKWAHLRNIEVSPVLGTPAERRAALKRPANVFTINYDNVPWLVEHYGKNWPFRKIVSDESTRLKGFRLQQGGKRAQQLARVAHVLADYFFELTGTPSPNGLKDLWGQAWFLDRGERLGRSYTAFKDRWFQAVMRGERLDIEPLPFAQAEIESRLRDLCLSLDARDYFDLAEPIVNTVRVELPVAARRMYREMEREMFLSLSDGTAIEAFNAASKTIKCLQLANGAIYTDATGEAFAEVHDMKLQALDSIVTEAAGMPVLVAYHFKSDLARLTRAFPQGRVLDDDAQTIRDWNAGKIPILFAHPASAGHGLNLQDGGNIIVFFGHWWNLEERMQIIERIGPTRQAQAGHDRPVFIYNIVAADTMDELVITRVETKREVQDLLLEAMKRRSS